MRIKITFKHNNNIVLPFDYQYAIQHWIYKTIANADADIATQLHDIGYKLNNKTFKHFCFSPWFNPKYTLLKEQGLKLEELESTLILGFYVPKILETYITGLFKNQNHTFYFKNNITFDVTTTNVEIMQQAEFDNKPYEYTLKSGVRISKKNDTTKHPMYIGPEDDEYIQRLKQNILNKYNSIIHHKYNVDDISITIKNDRIKSHMYNTHKDGNVIKSRAFSYNFELTAPKEIHETIYYAGLGEECSMGLGWVELGLIKEIKI
jgi:CRISPR-associated endoribonuclease Cas6